MIFLGEWINILFTYDAKGKPELRDALTRAIIDYVYLGKVPKFEDDSLRLIWSLIQSQAEPQKKKIHRKFICRINGKKGGGPRKDTTKDIKNN